MMPQDRVIYILVSCEIEFGGHAFTELVRADVRVRESWPRFKSEIQMSTSVQL